MILNRLLLWFYLCSAGLAFAHQGQHEQLDQINRLIAQQPDSQALYIQRGSIYSTGGQFELAAADYSRAAQLGPAVLVAFERGILYYRMGDFDSATDYLDQYITRFPSAARAYEYRAWVARDTGNFDRALADLNRYFELHGSPHPGNYISAANMLQDMGETEQALAVLDRGIGKLGLTPQLQRHAMKLELGRQQPANAISRLETLRVPLKENPAWKLEMAELLLLVNRRTEAGSLLLETEAELNALKPTPARIELLRRVKELKSAPEPTQPQVD